MGTEASWSASDMHFHDVAIRARLLKKKKIHRIKRLLYAAAASVFQSTSRTYLHILLSRSASCILYEMGPRSSKSESVGSRPSSDPANHKKNPSLQNKNDPNQALNEEQPSMFLSSLQWMSLTTPVVNTGTTLYSLQGMQHHDHHGRPISMYFHCSPESRAN